MPKNPQTDETIDFEKALAELEATVQQLEAGSLPLEKSLDLFKRGIELAKVCKDRLDTAQLKVTQLVKDNESLFSEEPFEEEEKEAGE
jgi:exodeoxyribonuclease VII small subunit